MDKWFSDLVRRLPAALTMYAISVAVLAGLARLCLPLLFTVLDKGLPAGGVTEFLILLLAWVPALATISFFVVVLAYLYWFYRRSKRL